MVKYNMDKMTEQMAIEILKAKLACKELEFSPHTECCEAKCDECVYAYAQGTVGEQKEVLAMAIQALEEIQQYRAIGTVEELKALKEKAEQGLFCKVGDTVYIAHKEIEPCRVSMITQKADMSWKFRLTPPSGWVFEVKQSDFGKTVFLTKEEAEQKLVNG